MKYFYFPFWMLLLLSCYLSSVSQVQFIENRGQWPGDFNYKAELPSGALFVENNRLVYHFANLQKIHQLHEEGKPADPNLMIQCHAYTVDFKNASTNPDFIEEYPTTHYNSYFLGNNPEKWQSSIYPHRKLKAKGLYPGVDLVLYSYKGSLKYDMVVSPGGSPGAIQMEFTGADSLYLKNNALHIVTSVFEIVEQEPYAYQVSGSDTIEIPCQYRLRGNQLSFVVGKYNPALPLIIDPSLVFGSYSGSTTDNWGYCATYDALGFLYSGGIANGLGFPTTIGAYQVNWNGGHGNVFPSDIVVSKYDTTGGFMVYSTYLGGSGSELPHSIIVNNYDEIFIYGTTGSADYPVSLNAYDNTFNGGQNSTTTSMNINYNSGSDIIISRLNATGTALLASTYIGGTGNDGINATPPLRFNYADEVRGEIIIDNQNNIYVATTTRSTDFPVTQGCFQPTYGGGTQDGVVFKMDNSLTTLIWSSYYGGTGNDAIYALDLYANDDIIVTGGTTSSDLFMTGPNFTTYNGGNADGFLAKIASNGSTILHSIYVGSPNYDQSYMVEKDKSDHVYVLGQTSAPGNYWIQNANFNTPSGGQFIRKFLPDLSAVEWSTAFGVGDGTPDISPSAFLVDVCNKIYVSGWGGAVNSGFYSGSTTNGLPVTVGAFQNSTDGSDYYLMVIDDSSNALVYATFYGGAISAEHVDGGTSRFNRKGEIYQSVCAGCGSNDDFPTTPGAHSQTNNSSNCNNGVFKFSFDFPTTVADFLVPSSGCVPAIVTFQNTSSGANGYEWDFGDGNNSTQVNPTHTYNTPGIYYITLIAKDTTGANCNTADTVKKQILILSDSTTIFPDIDLCAGESSVVGIPPNGDPSLTYSWSPQQWLSDVAVPNPIASPDSSITYQLLITNGNCVDTIIQTINVLHLPPSNDTTFLICVGDTISMGLNNVSGITNFQWFPVTGIIDPNTLLTSANPSSSTIYKLIYGNASCEDSIFYTVTIVPGQSFSNPPLLICVGDTIQIPSGNSGNNVFSWSPPTGLSNPNIEDPLAFPATSTSYVLLMNDGNCFDTLNQTINVTQAPVIPLHEFTICVGDGVEIGFPDLSGGVFSYLWTPDLYLSNANISNPYATPPNTITYTLETSLQGAPSLCNSSQQVTVHVETLPPVPGFSYNPSGSCNGIKMNFIDESSNATGVIWVINGDTLTSDQIQQYIAQFNDTISITQIVTLGECRDSLTQLFFGGSFADYFEIKMPNVFTPFTTYGINDTFCPIGFAQDEYCYKMYVYNRWGVMVWESSLEEHCWNGYVVDTYNVLVDGVYFWIIQYGDNSEEQGFVHVINHEN